MTSPDFPSSTTNSGGSSEEDLTSRLRDDGSTAAETAKRDFESITEKAAADVRALKEEAEQQASSISEKAKSFAGEQKDLLAGQINGIADAVSKVAGELEQSDQKVIGRYARDLAGGLSKFGNDVAGKDVDQLMGMAQSFGRQQPLAFLGAAALAGFMASRVAVASAHRASGETSGEKRNPQPAGAPLYRQEDE